MNTEFSGQFSKNTQMPNFMKIRPVGAEVFHADGWTDRQIHMTRLIVAFRNFANARRNYPASKRWWAYLLSCVVHSARTCVIFCGRFKTPNTSLNISNTEGAQSSKGDGPETRNKIRE